MMRSLMFLKRDKFAQHSFSPAFCRRKMFLCLVSSGLMFFLVGYFQSSIPEHSVVSVSIRSTDDPSTYHKLRKEHLDRVCRKQNVKENVQVKFVAPRNRSLPFDSAETGRDRNADEIPVTSHFYLASSYQTMGCLINKVASSSFVSAFLKIQEIADPRNEIHGRGYLLLPKSLEEFELAKTTFFKFMIVRHPMDRMLSAYLDKMVSEPGEIYLPPFRSCVKERGQKVILNRINKSLYSLPNCTAQAALDAIQLALANNNSVQDDDQNNSWCKSTCRSSNVPTFEEFLEYVLSTDLHGLGGYVDGMHYHWVPFHRYCSPCSINFDAVGKLETAAQDFEYIWNKSGLDKSGVLVPRVNANIAANRHRSKKDLEKRYYSSLPRELILRFYETFRMDFELFDYNIDDILIKAGYPPLRHSSS